MWRRERSKEGSEGVGVGVGGGCWLVPMACALPIFYNHFEELQTELFEVKLIIDNGPLT